MCSGRACSAQKHVMRALSSKLDHYDRFVILGVAKDLVFMDEILRCAQNDRGARS
jgi:hypothetical protein